MVCIYLFNLITKPNTFFLYFTLNLQMNFGRRKKAGCCRLWRPVNHLALFIFRQLFWIRIFLTKRTYSSMLCEIDPKGYAALIPQLGST